MKSFAILFVLLVALFATCTTRHIHIQGGTASSEEHSESEELREMEAACYEKTGSGQAFEALGASFAAAPDCIFMQIDEVDFLSGLDRLKANTSTRHEFFPKYCPQIHKALPCFEPSVNALSKCLDDDDALILRGTYDAMPEALNLICENDGEVLFREGANLDVCIGNFFNYSDPANVTAVSHYDVAQCGELSQAEGCMQGKLDECNGPSLNDVLHFWHGVLEEDTF